MLTQNNMKNCFLVLCISLASSIAAESQAALYNFTGQLDVYNAQGQLASTESAISASDVPFSGGAVPGLLDLNTQNPSGRLAPTDGEWYGFPTYFEIIAYFDQPGDYSWGDGTTNYNFTLLPGQVAMGTEFTWSLPRGIALLGWDISSGTVTGLDLDGDGIPGAAITAPAPGVNFNFSGTLTAVPIPPAALLFVSGLIPLISFNRHRKYNERINSDN